MKFKKGDVPKNKLSHEQWTDKNKDILNQNNISLLGKYIKSDKKILVRFNDCGHEIEMFPSNISRGAKCKICSGNQKLSNSEFKERFENADKYNEYELLSSYKGMNHKIKVKHSCGHIYDVTASKFIHGNKRCPKCKESKGEKHLYSFMCDHHFNFQRQYKIDNCKLKNKLPFDFAVFDKNNELLCLIEYQGEQHYYSRPFFGGDEGFEYQKLRDNIKRQYCEDNNIPLIEIPYWVVSPSKRLMQELKKLGITDSLNT